MKESQLSKDVKDYLQLMQNQKKIVWHDRLQSGKFPIGSGKYKRFIHLCKKGTPDRYCILSDGKFVWIEIKRLSEPLRKGPQTEFKAMIDKLPDDKQVHLTIRHFSQIVDFFQSCP